MRDDGLISAARRMPNAAWAWEGLRRNSAYRADYRSYAHAQPHAIGLQGGARLLRAKRRYIQAEHWGLLSFANPRSHRLGGGCFLATGQACRRVAGEADPHWQPCRGWGRTV